ncbi:chorismate-binding protein [Psychroserpens sp.]|uniref:chorismate-binding protein n=1 Tax=Psychroserpens sp. TaxID=2020870 RepID=UPI001B03BB55|nr:chorismate-binding protein [Psychroserpens sp.]MBO6606630.1 chorismate-binding protein [Psychroserpens sp.]MBO6631732.1 chorismate-binding protein [Psychroserpens sp.]MBO6653334.1 chorismate-binding protein [Psychroserpens sp.]MBO6680639.1 chorismate-binding protein [Psychroserpens sp.]MBO6750403.1 chorismate-binding protein [Psychroserpens sp.]
MLQEAFFKSITQQYKSGLPFVAYRKPNNDDVKAILQDNTTVHYCKDFTEQGFVFAPFDNRQETILFPLDRSEQLNSSYTEFDRDQTEQYNEYVVDSGKEQHITLVEKGIAEITSGKLEKVVLSRAEKITNSNVDPIELFKTLLHTYRTAMVYIWFHPKVGLWLGASPETLLKVEGRRFQTMSLAGTQKFQGTMDVLWDDKNKLEQNVVTLYIKAVLEPFSSQISIGNLHTHKAGDLLHLRSEILGVLKDDLSKDLIASLHPTPAVCGLPTTLAKDFILSNEQYAREYYTGYFGELNFKTTRQRNTNRRNVENNAYTSIIAISDFYVNLRCMQLREQDAIIYVGGGITKDSIPKDEWLETVNKARTIKRVLL